MWCWIIGCAWIGNSPSTVEGEGRDSAAETDTILDTGWLLDTGGAVAILHEAFDDPTLDGAWSVTFVSANGAATSLAGGQLSVADVTPAVLPSSTWAEMHLTRAFSPLVGDFYVTAEIGWHADGPDAMSRLTVELLDSNEDVVASVAYVDESTSGAGVPVIWLGASNSTDDKPLDQSGSATWVMARSNGDLRAGLDGSVQPPDFETDAVIDAMRIRFGAHPLESEAPMGELIVYDVSVREPP